MDEKWKKKRKLTFVVLTIEAFSLGCDFEITLLNLWLYLKSVVKTGNPLFLYGIIAVIYFMSAALSSIVIGRITDRTRQVRLIFFLSNILSIVGNIVYVIPFSYWYLLIGRLLAGSGHGIRSLITGEITRCYNNDEISNMFAVIGSAHATGITVSPIINLLVHSVNFEIGELRITYFNAPSLIMAVAFLLIQLLAFCMVYDLSRGNDVKKEKFPDHESESKILLDNTDECNDMNQSDEDLKFKEDDKPLDESYSVMRLFGKLVSNCDTSLLLILQFLETFFIYSFCIQDPLIFMQIMKWSVSAFNWLMFLSSISLIIPCIILTFLKVPDKKIFYLAISGIFSYCILQLIEITWAKKLLSTTGNIILCVFYCFCWGQAVFLREVFITGFLSKMVGPCHKSTTDGIRLGISKISAVIAVLSAPYALMVIDRVGTALIIVQAIVGVLIIARYKTMMSPKVIIT